MSASRGRGKVGGAILRNIVTCGFAGLGAEGVGLLAMCRRYGMRLADPNWGASGNHSGRDHGFLPRLPGGGRRR